MKSTRVWPVVQQTRRRQFDEGVERTFPTNAHLGTAVSRGIENGSLASRGEPPNGKKNLAKPRARCVLVTDVRTFLCPKSPPVEHNHLTSSTGRSLERKFGNARCGAPALAFHASLKDTAWPKLVSSIPWTHATTEDMYLNTGTLHSHHSDGYLPELGRE